MKDLKLSQAQIKEINNTATYVMFSVFSASTRIGPEVDRAALVDDALAALTPLQDAGLIIRGWYDVGGLRGDADLVVWWHGPAVEIVQDAYRAFTRTELGAYLNCVWSNVGLTRPAEFNRGHIPAFMADETPKKLPLLVPICALLRLVFVGPQRTPQYSG